MSEAINALAAELLGSNTPNEATCRVEPAVVTDTTTYAAADGNATCVIRWRGTTLRAAYLNGYTPEVGDTVILFVQGTSRFILGTLAGVNFAPPPPEEVTVQQTGSTTTLGLRTRSLRI